MVSILLSACGGGENTTTVVPAAPITLTSIAITPATAMIAKGAAANLTATGTFSNSKKGDRFIFPNCWVQSAAVQASIGQMG